MPKKSIQPEGLLDPRPKFAHVTKIGNQVYVAGQTSMDADGNLVGKGDIEIQTRQVFENIARCLKAAGASFDQVVKVNVYSTDLEAHLPYIARIRQEYFPKEPVASTTVQIPRLVHPDWLVEIEVIAVID
ncbi:MAG: RidA family protein [Deltaproteobacteria bacterium]|nr:RidA family protein [Deltaproteobacteria bacterium]